MKSVISPYEPSGWSVVRDVMNGLEPDMDNAVRWTAYALQESDEARALAAALDTYHSVKEGE